MSEAAKNPDPGERKQQLERLAREERRLQEESQRMARRLERLTKRQGEPADGRRR